MSAENLRQLLESEDLAIKLGIVRRFGLPQKPTYILGILSQEGARFSMPTEIKQSSEDPRQALESADQAYINLFTNYAAIYGGITMKRLRVRQCLILRLDNPDTESITKSDKTLDYFDLAEILTMNEVAINLRIPVAIAKGRINLDKEPYANLTVLEQKVAMRRDLITNFYNATKAKRVAEEVAIALEAAFAKYFIRQEVFVNLNERKARFTLPTATGIQ